ncbi:DUF998 domain-containing protein [uncultured Tissierella sp.]|jgi:hypothetical protein|uniref:DUF998 domain-containing protein n=1 Tax=uncultured Tissierella sp. TaxID=448160 RepID=UPI0028049294|nr:DUF998 domain-containing protein [uncultured Tissierella sp.]MDU5083476.1 DUF998 domain-containing protein [Bacillota bacterium]
MKNNITKSFGVSDVGFILLLIATIGDLLIPFFLAPFCKKYNHMTMVMSLLGNRNSPVHLIYNLWLIAAGIMLILGGLKLYAMYLPASNILSQVLLFCVVFYAIGACILSGIFSVGETKALITLPEKIHGYGSVLGFIVLTFVPLIIGIVSMYSNEVVYSVMSFIFFALSILFFAFFVMADKARFENTIISNEGIWQRLSLLCMYAPIIMVSFKNIFMK